MAKRTTITIQNPRLKKQLYCVLTEDTEEEFKEAMEFLKKEYFKAVNNEKSAKKNI